MSKRLLFVVRDFKKRDVNKSDSKTPKRDAISMSRTILLTPLIVKLERSSQYTEISRVSSSLVRILNMSMPSFATNPLITLLSLNKNFTCLNSMVRSSMSTTMS